MFILELILLVYFTYVTAYSFIMSCAAMFYKPKKVSDSSLYNKIAVLIPAYKEDFVITGVAQQALNQDYPSDHYDVVVIADSLQPATLEKLRKMPIKVVEVVFDKSTKVRALNKAMEVLGDIYDAAVILDADNVMERSFVRKMNNLYNLHYKAIQGRRAPKNENTSMAKLDGISETINNFIYRQGHVAIGLSSSLSGSGMFFDYKILKSTMATMDSVGGFDRELEYKLHERNVEVHYAYDIVVFDEKVDRPEVFEKQRTRWMSSQFVYLKRFFGKGCAALLRGQFNYFNATVLRNIQLPRLLNLGLLTFVIILALVFYKHVEFHPLIWIGLMALNIAAMAFALPAKFYNKDLLKSVMLVPTIFFKMLKLVFRMKGANRSFIHTPHGHLGHQEVKNI